MENNHDIVMNTYTFQFQSTTKELRRIGFNLGYGATTGVFSAIFMIHLGLGVVKALKRHADKKAEKEANKIKEEEEASEK